MLEKVLKTLEYDKIRAMVAERTQCCTGRELAEAMEPVFTNGEAASQMALTAEAEKLLIRTGRSRRKGSRICGGA